MSFHVQLDGKEHNCLGSTIMNRTIVKSSRLPVKIASYLVCIGRLLCLAFFYGWHFLNKISMDWPHALTTQPSTLKLFDNPVNDWGVLSSE